MSTGDGKTKKKGEKLWLSNATDVEFWIFKPSSWRLFFSELEEFLFSLTFLGTWVKRSSVWPGVVEFFTCVFYRDHEIRETRQEKAVELEERVEDVLRQGQKDLQETRTKHKKELAKVSVPAFSRWMINQVKVVNVQIRSFELL